MLALRNSLDANCLKEGLTGWAAAVRRALFIRWIWESPDTLAREIVPARWGDTARAHLAVYRLPPSQQGFD